MHQGRTRSGAASLLAVTLAAVVAAGSCRTTMWRASFVPPEDHAALDAGAPFVKAHAADGAVTVLADWSLDREQERLAGRGIRYDADRRELERGMMEVSLADVALLETNRPEAFVNWAPFAVMGVLTGVSLIGTALCLANPKACFGSCPTFYAPERAPENAAGDAVEDAAGERWTIQAEGFSAAVARTLEQTDVDALFTTAAGEGPFALRMTNEALETHFVDEVRLLALPRPAGARVLRAGERFYPTRALHAAESCRSERGDCVAAVAAVDDAEYLSPADGEDLAAREVIELTFPPVEGTAGIVIGGRNSLLNTFLFYQTLAYMGRSAGEWIMKLERGGAEAAERLHESGAALARADVQVLTRHGWRVAGGFGEVGPIAREVELVVLPADLPPGPVHVRLDVVKGYWKFDWLALAALEEPVAPTAVPLRAVEKNGEPDPAALALLSGRGDHLVSWPGDAWTLWFDLPAGDHELFLEARGFYYEWMREQWLAEEDPEAVAQILFEPEAAWRRLAPAYKALEDRMEDIFWQSRYGRGGGE